MFEKQNIEAFLKANGVKATATDEEIRSVLISAKWDHSEVDTALVVLKENIKSHETHVDTLHKVFNTDNRLNAAEINALLGIHVALSNDDVSLSVSDIRRRAERHRVIASFILSILLAGSSIAFMLFRVRDTHPIAAAIHSVKEKNAADKAVEKVATSSMQK